MSYAKIFYFAVAIIFILEICQITCDKFKVIETNDGAVRGVKVKTWWKNVDYYSFRGIPYARKPIGKLRYKAPKPVKPWRPEVLDALEFGNKCIQLRSAARRSTSESEDCLFLNIYVPAGLKRNEKVPVLFFIHGGGYKIGSGNDDMHAPDFLIEKRVIVVTFNFRLNIFGFLSLNTSKYSGNMGLKDQQLALKWIHDNIEHFKGDNSKLTIFGLSSGAPMAQFHILSAESRRYFQNAIAISGTVFNYWALSERNDHLEIAYEMAKKLGKPVTQLDELVKVLQSETPEKIIEFLSSMLRSDRTMSYLFSPVIERADAVQPFITESVETIYDTQDINVTTMFTATSAEMLTFFVSKNTDIMNIDRLNTDFSIKLPFKSHSLAPDSQEYRALNREIRQFYFGNDVINGNKSTEYVALLSDVNFIYGIDKAAKLHASKSKGKTFYVRFSVESKLNIFKQSISKLKVPGAGHADDIFYVFRGKLWQTFYDDVFNTQDDEQSMISIQTIERMTDLYTKFSEIDHSGCSTYSDIGFKPIQNGEINFMDITNEGLKPGINPNARAMEFWSNIEKRVQDHIGAN